MRKIQDEPSFWYSKARQKRVMEIELRELTRDFITKMEKMTRAFENDQMRPVYGITTKEEGGYRS